MSGVEVLGLVLGAIPLLVSAFEHFRDACIARDMLFQFESNYGHILRQVKDEELFFRMHLKKLLLPLIQDAVCDIDTLLLDPRVHRWRDQGIDELLKRRLTDGHERYIELLDSVAIILHKLLTTLKYTQNPFQQKLEALKDAEASNGLTARLKLKLKANLRFRAKHLDYVVSKWNRDALIDELRESREKLEKILDDNTDIAAIQGHDTMIIPGRAVRSLLQHWQHANRVYDLIFKHHESATFELKLLVFFSSTTSLSQLCPWQQHGLRIQSIDHLPDSNPPVDYALTTTPMRSRSIDPAPAEPMQLSKIQKMTSVSKKPYEQIKHSVRFMLGTPAPTSPQPSTSSSSSSKPKKARYAPDETPNPDSQSLEEIHNLCKALENCGMESVCIGALTAREDSHSYRYKVSSQPEQKLIAEEISLFEILQPSHRPRLPRADRMTIALKIASSHLKLHSTPWVRKQWEAKNIKFPCTRPQGSDRVSILTDKPFISTDFIEEPFPLPPTAASTTEFSSSPDEFDPSTKSFVCLGIMLLELQFGYLLEEHDLWQRFCPSEEQGKGNGKSDPLLRLMVAGRWALAAEGEAGRDFARIVKWCLNESPATLRDEKWRKDLADRVVLPLQRCCEWVAG